jgi:sn-glycerol 3-phosphate transport system substrate-binding protein
MMWTTTGNLTNVRNNAPFDFGVAMLPANLRRGAPTGGGNLFILRSTPEREQASLDFIRWLTSPELQADWGIQTGYVATSPAAWETEAMREYVADFPQAAVARDQLEHAVAELSTHENQRVTRVLNDALQAAITGEKPAAEALADAQAEATRILAPYR